MAVEVLLPMENPNDTSAEVVRWLVEDGQWVTKGDDVVEVESTKAVMTVAVQADGYLKRVASVSDVVTTGTRLALIYPTAEALSAHAFAEAQPEQAQDAVVAGARFSGGGRAELDRLGLDPALFAGRGLVTAGMVREFASAVSVAAVEVERAPVRPAKQTEIDRLTAGAAALASALTVSFDSARLRAQLLLRRPIQPLPLAIVVHGLAKVLPDFPDLNARFAGTHIERYRHINVGIAVDFGYGLRVPVIKDADRLDPDEITLTLLDMMAAYHERRLSTSDVSGGTVTVSDLSGDDVVVFHPRINQDQTLALGIGADSAQPGHPMTLTAVFDHRACTGRTVAQFLGRLKAHLMEEAQR